jgi:hypothetical protein
MIMFMAQQQQQQAAQAAATAEAERQAQIQAQQQAGMQAQQQSQQTAIQSLNNMNVGQQAQDQAALSNQKSYGMGAGMDVGAARQSSLQQMGAGTAVTPVQQGMSSAVSQAANIGAGGTQQRGNMFSVPTTTGLTFGGA